jgi:hypothetical protein
MKVATSKAFIELVDLKIDSPHGKIELESGLYHIAWESLLAVGGMKR